MISFNNLKKNLKKNTSEFKQVKVALLSDSASQLLVQAIKGYGIELGLNFIIYESEYNQIELQIFDLNSELYIFEPEVIFINFSTEHILNEFNKLDSKEQITFSNKKLALINKLYKSINSRISCKVIINNFIEINDNVFGNFAGQIDSSFTYQLRRFNISLHELSKENQNLFICDLCSLQAQYGYHFIFDPKLYVTSDIVYSLDFLPEIAKQLTDIILAINGNIKKCLILDLDNTTWGGIIGDDGIEGIEVGSLGIGKVFTEIQLWIKQLKQRGIIVCVCSKNTEEIAKEPFEKHPEMVLKLSDIAVFVANWENKVDNIKYIQSVLNIGFDSMVFLDDNPFEREMVKIGIPDILVPELPEDPSEYLLYLRTLNLFETISFTQEDSLRTIQYQEEAQRNQVLKNFSNEIEFLESLEMQSEVSLIDKFTIPRVAQLSQRSNQFNLRTIRYTEEDIFEISISNDFIPISFTLKDKFGDYGLIASVILKKLNQNSVFIDTWIMSCRVLKRGMENFTLNYICFLAIEKGFTTIIGEYIPTKKNEIVRNHYQELGFVFENEKWNLDLLNFKPTKNYINK